MTREDKRKLVEPFTYVRLWTVTKPCETVCLMSPMLCRSIIRPISSKIRKWVFRVATFLPSTRADRTLLTESETSWSTDRRIDRFEKTGKNSSCVLSKLSNLLKREWTDSRLLNYRRATSWSREFSLPGVSHWTVLIRKRSHRSQVTMFESNFLRSRRLFPFSSCTVLSIVSDFICTYEVDLSLTLDVAHRFRLLYWSEIHFGGN